LPLRWNDHSQIVSTGRIWIGCCGWAGARAPYFQQFRTIELQNTFYQPPKIELVEKWKHEAPEGFRFCLKAWQLITHPASSPTYRKLKILLSEESKSRMGGFQQSDEVYSAWETTLAIARALEATVILFQCPASFGPEERNIRNLEAFFSRIAEQPYRFAWEPRGNWPRDLVRDLCARLRLIHCVDPMTDQPVTEETQYLRLHGRGGYHYRYRDSELRELAGKLLAGRGQEAYVLFNNTSMRDDAARLAAMIEEAAGPSVSS
jgi:uncharacterized protein YecE (DUF72 family)